MYVYVMAARQYYYLWYCCLCIMGTSFLVGENKVTERSCYELARSRLFTSTTIAVCRLQSESNVALLLNYQSSFEQNHCFTVLSAVVTQEPRHQFNRPGYPTTC